MRKIHQRILSMLLVAAMVMTMLPVVATAANTEEDLGFTATDTSGNYVELKLMGATSLYTADGTKITKDNVEDGNTLDDLLWNYPANEGNGYVYNTLSSSLELEGKNVKKTDANDAIMAQYAEIANKLFADETEGGTKALKVLPGQTMFLAIDLVGHFGGDAPKKGIVGTTLNFLANTDIFTLTDASSVVVNHLLGGGSSLAKFALGTAQAAYPSYVGEYGASDFNGKTTYDDSTGFGLVFKSDKDYYMSEHSSWEFLIPITIAASATPGTYYINPINVTEGKNITVTWSDLENGTTNLHNVGDAANKGSNNLSANSIKVEVVNPSDPLTGDSESYKSAIKNNKNDFFTGDFATNNEDDLFLVPTDLTAEEGKSVFEAGDQVVVYDNATDTETGNDICGEELGRATIVADDESGTVTQTAGALYAPLKTEPEKEGDPVNYFVPDKGGKLWIDVIKKAPAEGAPFTPSEKPIQITVSAEQAYYSGDTSKYPVYTTGLGSKDKPIEVTFGGKLQEDVLSQLAEKPKMVENVLLDSGETVTVSLDWSDVSVASAPVTLAGTEEVTAPNPSFASHDKLAEIIIPFPDETKGGYAQGGANTSTEYGAVIYATVLPVAGDYTVQAAGTSSSASLTLSGETATVFTDTTAGDGDTIKIYDAATGGNSIEVPYAARTLTDGKVAIDLTVPDAFSLTAGNAVYVTYTEKDGEETNRVSVTVVGSDGSALVTDDVQVNPVDKPFIVAKGSALSDLLNDTNEDGSKVYEAIEISITGGKKDTLDLTTATESDFTMVKADDSTFDTFANAVAAANNAFDLKYAIQDKTTGDAPYKGNGKAIITSIVVWNQVAPAIEGATATESGVTVANNPYPTKDVISFKQTNSADPEGVKNGDKVTIYADADCKTALASTTVGGVTVDASGNVTIKVDQISAKALEEAYMVISRDNTLASEPIKISLDAEPYTITKVTPMDTATVKFPAKQGTADTTWADIYAKLPTKTQISYARFQPKGDESNTVVLDPASVGTMDVNLAAWDSGELWAANTSGAAVTDALLPSMKLNDQIIHAKVSLDGLTVTEDGAAVPVKTTSDTTLIPESEVGTALQLSVRIVDEAANEDEAKEKMARLTVTNNPFPQEDEVTFTSDGDTAKLVAGDVLRFYAADPSKDASAAVLASHTLTDAEITAGKFAVKQLGSTKGAVYATIQSGEATASAPVSIALDEEPWVLYELTLSPDAYTVSQSDSAHSADALDTLKTGTLPTALSVGVAHLAQVGSDDAPSYSPAFKAATTAPLDPNGWTVGESEPYALLAASHLESQTGTNPLKLHPTVQYDSATHFNSLTDLTIGANGVRVVESTAVTVDTTNLPTVSLTVNGKDAVETDPTDPVFENPADPDNPGANSLLVKNEKGPDDSIELRIQDTKLLPPTVKEIDISYRNNVAGMTTVSDVQIVDGVAKLTPIGLTPAFAKEGVVVTFKADGKNDGYIKADIPAEPAVTTIASVSAGLKLHLGAGDLTTVDELKSYAEGVTLSAKDDANADIPTSVGLTISDAGWSFKKTESDADVAATRDDLAVAGTYKLVADVVLPAAAAASYELGADAQTVEIPVTITADGEATLAPGNNDLYLHGEEAGTPAATKLAELQAADSTVTKEDFKHSLVFFYRYEEHDTDIAPWTDGSKLTAIGGTAITDLDAWKAAAPAGTTRKVEVSEVNADGTAINKELTLSDSSTMTLTTIQPRHVEAKTDSSDAKEYFTLNTAGGIRRSEEFYKIVYKVTDGEDVYVATYDVKLRYKAGDANLDGSINIQDAGYANQYSINLAFPFLDTEGNDIPALSLSVLDLNEDKSGNIQDAGYMNQLSINLITYPYCRY